MAHNIDQSNQTMKRTIEVSPEDMNPEILHWRRASEDFVRLRRVAARTISHEYQTPTPRVPAFPVPHFPSRDSPILTSTCLPGFYMSCLASCIDPREAKCTTGFTRSGQATIIKFTPYDKQRERSLELWNYTPVPSKPLLSECPENPRPKLETCA